jgi:hypothetical protein
MGEQVATAGNGGGDGEAQSTNAVEGGVEGLQDDVYTFTVWRTI